MVHSPPGVIIMSTAYVFAMEYISEVYLPLDMEVLSSFHEPRGYLAVDNSSWDS